VSIKGFALALLTIALYLLHQDTWFWREARPLVFGILPVGLFYHAAYTLAAALLMTLLVRAAWPSELERRVDPRQPRPGGPE
jgi:hypothetical protein